MAGNRSGDVGARALIPECLLLPLGDALRPWRAVVCSPSMPTPDVEAALHKIVWAVAYAGNATALLQEMAYEMAFDEALYEHAQLTPQEKRSIFDATLFLGAELIRQLIDIKAYLDGVFPYELQGLLPDDTLVLRRVPANSTGSAGAGNPGYP